jgi:hypothetical protein
MSRVWSCHGTDGELLRALNREHQGQMSDVEMGFSTGA